MFENWISWQAEVAFGEWICCNDAQWSQVCELVLMNCRVRPWATSLNRNYID